MDQPVAPTAPDLSDAANPYAQMENSDTQAADTLNASGNMVTAQETSMLGQYAGNGSSYPATTNTFGLGDTQSTPVAGSASNPTYGGQPISVSIPDTSSRGFNPWSLSGEANARGK